MRKKIHVEYFHFKKNKECKKFIKEMGENIYQLECCRGKGCGLTKSQVIFHEEIILKFFPSMKDTIQKLKEEKVLINNDLKFDESEDDESEDDESENNDCENNDCENNDYENNDYENNDCENDDPQKN